MKLIDNLHERLGMNAYVQGDYARAEKYFRSLEKQEPDSIRVLRNLGVILLARGNAEEAERYFLREERLYGESLQRHRALADLAYAVGKREAAVSRYAAALASPEAADADGTDRAFLRLRHEICGDEARFEAARNAAALFSEGEAARERGDADAALAAFLAAAEADPTHWPALNNAGVILLERKDGSERALELFRKAAACARVPTTARNIALAEELVKRRTGPRAL